MSLFSFFSRRRPEKPPQPTAPTSEQPPVPTPIEPVTTPSPTGGESAEISWAKRIPSRPEEGKVVLEEVMRQLAALRWSDRDLFGVRLALEEALMNAIKHGNGFDPNKDVEIVCRLATDFLHIEIQDEGPGFRLEDVPDPTDPENLEKPSGRGIVLMRNFMTHVEYNEIGNRVILEKRRTAEAA
jgi:serine/threonine-protein kinase RsbW